MIKIRNKMRGITQVITQMYESSKYVCKYVTSKCQDTSIKFRVI